FRSASSQGSISSTIPPGVFLDTDPSLSRRVLKDCTEHAGIASSLNRAANSSCHRAIVLSCNEGYV
ncbi:hypothetical protein JMJ77_0000555, partial [Colletotrichum scovillei]